MASRFDARAAVEGKNDGQTYTGGLTFSPYYRLGIETTAGKMEIDDGDICAPRFVGKNFMVFNCPQTTVTTKKSRCEVSTADEQSTPGQRDPLHTQPNGTTRYIAFSFQIVGPVDTPVPTGSWGYLVIQGKSLVTNGGDRPNGGKYTSGKSPQISLLNEGSGSRMRIRLLGGSVGNIPGPRSAWVDVVRGRWYDVILGIKAETDNSGFAKLWMVRAGQTIPPEASPTTACLNTPTNLSEFGTSEPILYRHGVYMGPNSGDKVIAHTGLSMWDTYAEALATFTGVAPGGGGTGGGGTPPPTPAPLAATSLTISKSDLALSGSVTLPADSPNRDTAKVVAFPRPITAGDSPTSTDAVVLLSTATASGTFAFGPRTLSEGTWYVRCYNAGVGGTTTKDASPASVTLTAPTAPPPSGSGISFIRQDFAGTVGSAPAIGTWRVTKTNQGASSAVTLNGDGTVNVIAQSLNGAASRIVLELLTDLTIDFATGADTRVAMMDFTHPNGNADISLYVQGGKNVDSPIGGDDWARVEYDARVSPVQVSVRKRENAGAEAVLGTDTYIAAIPAGTPVAVQVALDRTKLRAAYETPARLTTVTSTETHGLAAAMTLASVRLAFVIYTTSTTPVSMNVGPLTLMRATPNPPDVTTVQTLRVDGTPWINGTHPAADLASIQVSGTFPVPDSGLPTQYLADIDDGTGVLSSTLPITFGAVGVASHFADLAGRNRSAF